MFVRRPHFILINVILLVTLTLSALARAAEPAGKIAPTASPSTAAPLTSMPVFDVINDPIEPFNRSMWGFNKGLFNWVIYPINVGYQYVFPAPVRKSIGKFGWNLKYPVHLLNNLLQGKMRGAGAETNRFLINTTMGGLGFFDPATSVFKIAPSREDFGQTLGTWGGTPGFYLMLPFMGPASGRDAVGKIVDFPFDVTSWIFGARAFLSNNQLSFNSDRLSDLINYEADPYVLIRNLWALDRERQVRDYQIKPVAGDPEPSLDTIFLTPRDPKFRSRGYSRQVLIPETGKAFPYSYWVQEQPAPVVVILPGLGGHRLGQSTVALAEMAYRNGYSVVTISSTMNWEFMCSAATTPVPGHPAFDSLDVIRALKAVRADLRKLYPNHGKSVALLGYSLGGIHTLRIAALEAGGQTGGKLFDRYLAINPPPDIFHALGELDNYCNSPLRWPAAQREAHLENTLLKAVAMGQGELTPTGQIPLTRLESEFLIGLSFRMALRDVIYVSQSNQDLGVLKVPASDSSRQSRYCEIRQYGYRDYMEKFVLPYYLSRKGNSLSREKMIEAANLTPLTPWLKDDPKVWVHTNANDFLLQPQDIEWFKTTFGQHFVLFGKGGHLGNLYKPEVQQRIMDSLAGMK